MFRTRHDCGMHRARRGLFRRTFNEQQQSSHELGPDSLIRANSCAASAGGSSGSGYHTQRQYHCQEGDRAALHPDGVLPTNVAHRVGLRYVACILHCAFSMAGQERMLCSCSLCSATRQADMASVLPGILLNDEGQVDEGGAWQVTKHASQQIQLQRMRCIHVHDAARRL